MNIEDDIRIGIFDPPKFQMPNFYRPGLKPGLELPLYWRDDATGILVAAVPINIWRIGLTTRRRRRLDSTRCFEIILRHYINAPAWTTICKDAFDEELASLRERVKALKEDEDFAGWIWDCLEIGLDPL